MRKQTISIGIGTTYRYTNNANISLINLPKRETINMQNGHKLHF